MPRDRAFHRPVMADPTGAPALCDGKVPLTAEVARQVLARPGSKEKGRTAYKCPICRAWHVGRPPPKPCRPKGRP